MFPIRVPTERDTSSPEPLVYLLIYVCQIAHIKDPSYKMGRKVSSSSTDPHADGMLTYNGVRPGSTREWLTTLLFLFKCQATYGTIPSTLACVDWSPISQRVS